MIACSVVESGIRISQWLSEIWHGAESAKELESREAEIPMRLWTDAYDVFSTLRCPLPYKGTDGSAHLQIEGLKEEMRMKLTQVGWCPTNWMAADSFTKWKKDVLLGRMMDTGRFHIEGYEVMNSEDVFKGNLAQANSSNCGHMVCFNCAGGSQNDSKTFFSYEDFVVDEENEGHPHDVPRGPCGTVFLARRLCELCEP